MASLTVEDIPAIGRRQLLDDLSDELHRHTQTIVDVHHLHLMFGPEMSHHQAECELFGLSAVIMRVTGQVVVFVFL